MSAVRFFGEFWRHWLRHWGDLGLVFGVFVMFVAVTNLAHNIFGLRLTEFFEATFESLHAFVRAATDVLVFSWLSPLLGSIWFVATGLISLLLPFVVPYFPTIVFPPWYSDLALVSLVLSRAFDSAYILIPRDARAEAERQTTPEMLHEMEASQRVLNWPHKITHWITVLVWKCIRLGQRVLSVKIVGLTIPANVSEGILKSLAAVVFMWGFVRLIGYSINVGLAGRLDHIPLMRMRRKLFSIFWYSFVTALAASAVFFFINGLMVPFEKPSSS